jgi:hypothetical protein
MRWSMNRIVLTGCALLIAAGPARAAVPALPVVQSQDFAGLASKMAAGSRLRLENLQVANTGESRALVLERFEVFAKDAKITIHGEGGDEVLPAPANAYFRGVVDGKPESRAFLARLADGRTQGVISEEDDVYLIGGDDAAAKALGPLEMHRVDPVLLKAARGEAFNCGNAQLPGLAGKGTAAIPDFGGTAPVEKEVAAGAAAHTGRVAIETDFEFYSLFNNSTTATNYIGNLIGYASTIYTAELNTSLVVQSVSLWTTSNDPWTQTSTFCGLLEFGKYWNQNKTGISRTIAHFLSGKSLGGGIAWLNALCHGQFSTGAASSCPGLGSETTPWGGDYGFTANIGGNFNINNPTVVWDIYSTSHEIGHNFGSPHSHCYNGLEGNASPIDQCYGGESGCYSGATSLPGPGGTRSGTIMSYCHLIGGYGAIALTFGTNFAYGVQPGREAAHMNSYISSVASFNPACVAPVSVSGLFNDGFEGGAVPGLWSGKTP